MIDYLLMEDLARERNREVQRLRAKARLIAEAETRSQESRARHFTWIGHPLGDLVLDSLWTWRTGGQGGGDGQ